MAGSQSMLNFLLEATKQISQRGYARLSSHQLRKLEPPLIVDESSTCWAGIARFPFRLPRRLQELCLSCSVPQSEGVLNKIRGIRFIIQGLKVTITQFEELTYVIVDQLLQGWMFYYPKDGPGSLYDRALAYSLFYRPCIELGTEEVSVMPSVLYLVRLRVKRTSDLPQTFTCSHFWTQVKRRQRRVLSYLSLATELLAPILGNIPPTSGPQRDFQFFLQVQGYVLQSLFERAEVWKPSLGDLLKNDGIAIPWSTIQPLEKSSSFVS